MAEQENQPLIPPQSPSPRLAPINADEGINDKDGVLGDRNAIGMWGSIAYLANRVYSAGAFSRAFVFPVALLNGGWVLVSITNVVACLVSIVGALMLIEAMATVDGNANFGRRTEYTTLIKWYVYPKSAVLGFICRLCFHATVQFFNLGSIVLVAQGLDNVLVWSSGQTYALQVMPEFKFITLADWRHPGDDLLNSLYSGYLDRIGITLGYVLSCVFTIPLGTLSISDSIWIQVVSFVLAAFTVLVMFGHFCKDIVNDNNEVRSHDLRAFENGDASLAVVATTVSYMYAMYLPSWINEKQQNVPVKSSIWGVGLVAMVVYISVGAACAIAHPFVKDANVLQHIFDNKHTSDFMRVTILIFIFAAVLPGIPINSITVKYNLYVSQACGKNWAFFWGSIAPYLIAWVFSCREIGVGYLVYTIFFTGGIVNFIVPPLIYYEACRHTDVHDPKPEVVPSEQNQKAPDPDFVGAYDEESNPEKDATVPWSQQDTTFAGAFHEESLKLEKDSTLPWSPRGVAERQQFALQGSLRDHYGKVTFAMIIFYLSLVLFLIIYKSVVQIPSPWKPHTKHS